MKKLTLFLIVAIVAMIGAAGAQAKKKSGSADGTAKIEFASKTFDFGVIKESAGPVTHEFEFVNNGDGNLLILKASAECGCTRPSFPEKPVAPGKSGKIKVTYNPAGRPGGFDKVVTVTTNGQPRKIRLKIRGTVK
ncbi:MAG: DUF1573 domain-containing protein [Muribaculaceae bacterium]|nr:DUF1573 domain-containing protein [Muribaculaceae bacterium]MDE7082059.1 DUF1573 domain-containing protein [Muribaculaceae bacterium]